MRERVVKVKLNFIKELIKGKRVVVIDDFIVCGIIFKKLIDILFEVGVKEVYFRLVLLVVIEELYFGVNIDFNNKLMGSYMSIEEIRKVIGVIILDYFLLKNLKKILNGGEDFYMGCFKEDE